MFTNSFYTVVDQRYHLEENFESHPILNTCDEPSANLMIHDRLIYKSQSELEQ